MVKSVLNGQYALFLNDIDGLVANGGDACGFSGANDGFMVLLPPSANG